MIRSAEFSECGKYRYLLSRDWDVDKPICLCIGLNPSTADAEKDDPTIRILIKALTHLGYGGLRMMNLYAIIESKSKNLGNYPDKLSNNDQWLEAIAYGVQQIVFCWGAFKGLEHRVKQVRTLFPSAYCFGKSKDGHPIHPMALMYGGVLTEDIKLIKF